MITRNVGPLSYRWNGRLKFQLIKGKALNRSSALCDSVCNIYIVSAAGPSQVLQDVEPQAQED